MLRKLYNFFVNFSRKEPSLCVALLITEKEIYSERFLRFVDYFFVKNRPSKVKKIKFYMFIEGFVLLNEDKKIKKLINLISEHCISFRLIFLTIKHEDNKYIKTLGKNKSEYGLSSGPNLLFFKSCRILSKLPDPFFLLLESDCIAVKNYWFDILEKECLQDFWMKGSKYQGSKKELKSQHLNGVAIYNNSSFFHKQLQETKKYIKNTLQEKEREGQERAKKLKWMIKHGEPSKINEWLERQKSMRLKSNIKYNYDVALSQFLEKKFSPEILSKKIIDCPRIVDYSLRKDCITPLKEIQLNHPKAVIIHQKPLSEKKNKGKTCP